MSLRAGWWRLLLPAPAMVALALAVEHSGLDLLVEDLFADGTAGFPLMRNWWADDFLHDGTQWLVRGIGIALLVSAWRHRHSAAARVPVYVLICLLATTGSVGLLKQATHKDCPWSLSRYGGTEPYVPLGGSVAGGVRDGRCFPGGHSSAAFAFFGLYFVARRWRPRLAPLALCCVVACGLLFGLTQWLRGAHFVSHDLWSAAIGWLVAVLALPVLDGQRGREPLSLATATRRSGVR